MPRTDSYGDRMGVHWRGHCTTTTLDLGKTHQDSVTIARITGGPEFGFVVPVPPEEGFAVSVQLMDYERGELWLDGRSASQGNICKDRIALYDLRQSVEALLLDPFDVLQFHIPRRHFEKLAAANGSRTFSELNVQSGRGLHDPTVVNLGYALLPALKRPAEANSLFLDHVLLALSSHLASTYAMPIGRRSRPCGLSSRHLRLAMEMLAAKLDGDITVADVAEACGLTPSYFARQFALSTGMAPHRWLLERRVDFAKQLMATSRLSLAEIAVASGFADQSHLTRVFSRIAGTTPKAWRDH